MDHERRRRYLCPGHPVPGCTTLGGSRCVPGSKWMLCMAVVAATGVVLLALRVVRPFRAWRERGPKRGAKRALPKPGVG
jgi:hypothetical protein